MTQTPLCTWLLARDLSTRRCSRNTGSLSVAHTEAPGPLSPHSRSVSPAAPPKGDVPAGAPGPTSYTHREGWAALGEFRPHSPRSLPFAFSRCLFLVGPIVSETSAPLWHPLRTCISPTTNQQSMGGIASWPRQHTSSLFSLAPPQAWLLTPEGTARMSGPRSHTQLPWAGRDSPGSFSQTSLGYFLL